MSFEDIRTDFSEINMCGETYKITYDFNAIEMLQRRHASKCFALGAFIDKVRAGYIEEIIDFCHVGFLRYHPDMDIEILKDHRSIIELLEKCTDEYRRTILMPDVFNELVYQNENEKKKKKKSIFALIGTIFKR